MWRAAGAPWAAVPPRITPRNVAITRAYLETDEPIRAIGARHGIPNQRVLPIALVVVYAALGRRAPRR